MIVTPNPTYMGLQPQDKSQTARLLEVENSAKRQSVNRQVTTELKATNSKALAISPTHACAQALCHMTSSLKNKGCQDLCLASVRGLENHGHVTLTL